MAEDLSRLAWCSIKIVGTMIKAGFCARTLVLSFRVFTPILSEMKFLFCMAMMGFASAAVLAAPLDLSHAKIVALNPQHRTAAKAAEMLRTWFLDPKTLMNPNLEFAQAVPGQNSGRGTGILESRALTHVVDSIGLINGSKSWTKADQAGLEAWFTKYYAWITTSKHGKDGAAAKNNHGTWYAAQAATMALYLGDERFQTLGGIEILRNQLFKLDTRVVDHVANCGSGNKITVFGFAWAT